MKYSRGIPVSLITLILFLMFLTSSCSLLSGSRYQRPSSANNKNVMIPKAQYDDLLQKYEALLREKEGRQDEQQIANQLVNQIADVKDVKTEVKPVVVKPAEPKTIESTPINVKKEIAKADSKMPQTVDVFIEKEIKKIAEPDPEVTVDTTDILVSSKKEATPDGAKIENEIKQLNNGIALVEASKFDDALKIFRSLEKNAHPQIKARVKFYLGELFFAQKEYDLAMQMFEDVVKKYAFSGVVIHALDRLVACTENLKLKNQQNQYLFLQKVFGGKV